MQTGKGQARSRWIWAGALAVGSVAMFSASSGFSQPAVGGMVPERVRELEARVARLELRLLAMERVMDQEVEPRSVKAFPAEDELGYEACDPPIVRDGRGQRLLKAGCEAHGGANPCDPPLLVDEEGIKTVRPGCEYVHPTAPCSPPYLIDANGQRVIRRECLDVGY